MRAPIPPILAILTDIEPSEVLYVVAVLIAAGIRAFEIPINGGEALESLWRMSAVYGGEVLCVAGAVLTPGAVDDAARAGAVVIGTPRANPQVIAHAVALGLGVMPGLAKPSEAAAAMAAGAKALKVSVAKTFETRRMAVLGETLPADAPVYASRAAGVADPAFWRAAGMAGLGVAEDLYKPGDALFEVVRRASALVDAWTEGAQVSMGARLLKPASLAQETGLRSFRSVT